MEDKCMPSVREYKMHLESAVEEIQGEIEEKVA